MHTCGTRGFPQLLLTRGAISYSQTHRVLPCSLSLRTAVCSDAFPLVCSFRYEELSVNQAEMLSWHDFCSQRLQLENRWNSPAIKIGWVTIQDTLPFGNLWCHYGQVWLETLSQKPSSGYGAVDAIALCARGEIALWSRECKVKRWFYLLRIFSIPSSFKRCIYDLDFHCSGL